MVRSESKSKSFDNGLNSRTAHMKARNSLNVVSYASSTLINDHDQYHAGFASL